MAFYADVEEAWKCPTHPSKRRKSGICPICLRDRLVTLCPECANVRPCACSPSLSKLIGSGPSFRRSRSTAIPFVRSQLAGVRNVGGSEKNRPPVNRSKPSFLSAFWTQKNKKGVGLGKEHQIESTNDSKEQLLLRSRSVSVLGAPDSGNGGFGSSPAKGRGWHFPSAIRVFRHFKASKVVQERSPLSRG